MRKSKLKQTISMLLAVLMVFMSMNFSVFAEELTAPTDETKTPAVEAPAEEPAEEQTPAVEAPALVDEETGTTEENTTDNSLQKEQSALLHTPTTNGEVIAKIDDQDYTDQATFLTAFNALAGVHTVQLLADVDLGIITTNNAQGHAQANDIFLVRQDAQIILDLNGWAITGDLASGNNYNDEEIIGNFGVLTIQDSSADKTGKIENTAANPNICVPTVSNEFNATLIVEGGTIQSTKGNAITNYGKITIYSGTIKTNSPATGGWDNGAAAIHNRGNLAIEKKDGLSEPEISTNRGYPVWCGDSRGIGNAQISAGKFTTNHDMDIKIQTGHFDTVVNVTGGTWDKDPTDYVSKPYIVKKDSGGIYTVVKGDDGTKEAATYTELKRILSDTTDNWVEILITDDITVTDDLTIPLKANVEIQPGKTLKISNGKKVELSGELINNGTLDISTIDSGWINNIDQFKNNGQIIGLPTPENNVYKISTVNQLQFLQYVMVAGNGPFTGTIEIQNPIDAQGYKFRALGDNTNVFSGTFDGKENEIKNITVDAFNNSGSLFNRVTDATFQNLNLTNCDIYTNGGYLGLLAGSASGTTIVKDSTLGGKLSADNTFFGGGLFGSITPGGLFNFENCVMDLDITAPYNVGTFWGSTENSSVEVTIVNCSNAGDINATGGSYGTIGGWGHGLPLKVTVFGYDYTGTVTENGKVQENPKYCTKSDNDQFIVAAARIQNSDGSTQYYGSIQEAVSNAANGDIIEIAPGTYNLESTLKVEKPLTLRGMGSVVIMRDDTWSPAQAISGEQGSLINIDRVIGPVVLENLTVQDARNIDGASGHGINIVQSADVTMKNITSKGNAAAGVVVNGSTVTATGLYTSGNGWYGVNVDQGNGVTDDTLFTLKAPYRFGETYQIVSDKYNSNDNIEVNLPDAFVQSDLENGSVYWNDFSTMIKNQNKNRTYPTIQAAIDDANRNNTILIPAGIYAEDLNIEQSVTLKKAENTEGDCVLDGNITVAEGKKVTLSDLNAGTNAAVMVKKGANLALVNSDAFVENQHITVEKLFGTEYDTSVIKQNDQEVAKDKLSFVYLGEEIRPDMNLFRADEVSYTVKTPAQFYWLSQQINKGSIDTSKVTIKLGNDLDFHNDEWLPVGVEGHEYKGNFDGQGKTISNLYINRPGENYLGLFGTANNNNALRNITFDKVEIIGKSLYNGGPGGLYGGNYAGALVGRLLTGMVDSVSVKSFSYNSDRDTAAGNFIGGVIGSAESINLSNSSVNTGVFMTSGDNVGGVIGFIESNANVTDCHGNNIDIAENCTGDAGGVIGTATNGNVKVYNCSVKNSTIRISTPIYVDPDYTYRGELIGEMRSGILYLYNCTSENTTAINVKIPNDESQLVGGDQTKIKILTFYNENTDTPYATIQEAINAANSGDTITVGAGIYDEAINLNKAVNLVGPNADINPNGDNDLPSSRGEEAILTGGINITRQDKDSSESISIKGLKFTKSGIYSVGWGNDPNLNSITIENNVFENIANELNNSEKNVSAIHFNLADNQPVQNCTIKNNRISGVANGDSSGINVFTVSGTTTITGNYIENTNHSALQIPGTAAGDVMITGNTFKDWDQDVANGGRAMRFGKFAKVDSMTVTNNKMIRDLEPGEDKDQMAKFDTIPYEGSLDFSLNYWNGKLPVTTYGKAEDSSVIVISNGNAKINALPYYADEEMKRPLVPVEVKDSTGNLKGNYLTIPEAVADAETKDHIVISEGIQTLSSSITIPSGKDLTFEGTVSDSGALLTTLQRSADDGNNIIFSAAQENVQTTVKNLNFVTTKEGASTFYSDKKSAELTIEGCSFNPAEGINYGGNIVMGAGVENTGKLSFVNNKVNFSFRNGINAAGNNSVITGNEFVYTSDRINDSNRTSVLSLVADDKSGIITITDNIFKNANRAIAVDNSKMLSGNNVTIKDNQFIDVRYGFELSSTVNKGCGVYDLSKNYYARTQPDGSEIAAPMLIEDADISEGTHFDGSRDYKGDQVNVYPYYVDKEMTKTYAPVEVQHKDEGAKTEYFGTIAKAYEAAHAGDTIVINRAANGSDAVIDEAVDMNTKDADLKLMGSTTFNGTFAGSTRASLILQNGTTATFTNTAQNAIQYFTSVDVENFNAEAPTQIVAPTVNTSQNSFIAKGGLMDYVKGDPNSTWTYGSPSDRFNGGDGTAEKPWQINTPEQLKLVQSTNTTGKYFKLTNDITVNDWTPLAKFEGNFNGNGYSITGNNVNFIDELAKSAKVEKLRFEGFTNLVNTNNGTVENCYTVGEKTTAIVNIMDKNGKLTDSFTAGTKAVQTNEAQGTILRVYYCGETGGIGTAMTKADMQKARFANTLNSEKEGVWDYNADIESPSAYPFVMKDDKTTTIQKLGEVKVICDSSIGKVSIAQPDDGIYAKDTITLKAEITNSDYDFLSWTNVSGEIIGINRTCDYTVRTKDDVGTFTANFTRKPTITVSALNFNASAGSISVNGIENSNAVNAEINVGTMARLKATPKAGYKFVKWTTLQDMNTAVSVEDTFTIYAGTSNLQYLAHFEEIQADKVTVSFKDSVTGAIIGQPQTIDKNGDVTVPEALVYFDRDFDGWYDGNVKASVVDGKIQNVQKDTTYEARYTQKQIQYTVTVTKGKIDGEEETSVKKDANSRVTVIANTPEQGKQFAGWKYTNGDSIISYDETYTFILKADTTIEATYSELPVEKQPTVSIDPNPVQIDQSEGLYKLRFIIRSEIPESEDFTPIKCGAVYKKENVNNQDDLFIGASGVSDLGKTNIDNQYVLTVNLGNMVNEQTASIRGYLIYMKNGETYTIYTDMIKGTVKVK
ncbi:InlB B-repeat-containing protein [Eubacterium callanderi]|uniref:InlB B-repeat-containing protein n=1 Tax=Eubacterium callanderi TaxID=53442 RepID=UPI00399BD7FB